jgi:hypothetical protein
MNDLFQSPEEDDKEKVLIEVQCRWVKNHQLNITVFLEDWLEWKGGTPKLIQQVFPYLTADEREIMISGTCPVCWEKMMKDMEDEDEDYIPEKILKED